MCWEGLERTTLMFRRSGIMIDEADKGPVNQKNQISAANVAAFGFPQ
jgi:hypothetical protein